MIEITKVIRIEFDSK